MEPPRSGVATGVDGIPRCWWCLGDPLYTAYHDREWGRPVADDTRIFEKICLEGFQSGLSWLTILRKRENFRRAFNGFDIDAVARFNRRSVERLLADPSIVRNRAKIEATINNAKRALPLVEESGSLAAYVWSFEPEKRAPAPRDWAALLRLGVNDKAVAMSKDLKRRGWAFVGPTTLHSAMGAMGLLNHHVSACHFRAQAEQDRASFPRPTGSRTSTAP